MAAKWGIYGLFVSVLVLSIGCRTPQPVLKPDKQPEVLRTAPQEARYESSTYPKMAYDQAQDPSKRYTMDGKSAGSRGGGMPGAGGMGGMGMGGMGGMAGR